MSTIIYEANLLIERIKQKYPVFTGRTVSKEELISLQDKLKIKLPTWYIDLHTQVPIIDAEFGFQEYEPDANYDGISFIIWSDINGVIEESLQFSPGIEVFEQGYIHVASCSTGSGDPIFIKLLYQITG